MPALGSDGRLTTSGTYVKWRRGTPLLDVSWFLLPPPHLRQGFLPRPDFVQRIPLIHPPVLHHVPDLFRVVYVVERVGIEHDQVRQLAGLERAQVLVHPDAVRAIHRTDAEHFARRHPAPRHGPQLPVAAEAVQLTVTS